MWPAKVCLPIFIPSTSTTNVLQRVCVERATVTTMAKVRESERELFACAAVTVPMVVIREANGNICLIGHDVAQCSGKCRETTHMVFRWALLMSSPLKVSQHERRGRMKKNQHTRSSSEVHECWMRQRAPQRDGDLFSTDRNNNHPHFLDAVMDVAHERRLSSRREW